MMIRMYLISATIALISFQSQAAEIVGRVLDDIGNPMRKVPLCISFADNPGECKKFKSTNARGVLLIQGAEGAPDLRHRGLAQRFSLATQRRCIRQLCMGPRFIAGRNRVKIRHRFGHRFHGHLQLQQFPEITHVDRCRFSGT